MMESSWLSVADVGVGACICSNWCCNCGCGCSGCRCWCMAICIVVSGAVGVSAFVVVYVGVGGGMHFTSCANNSSISAFCCLFASFLLYYNVLESI